MTAQLAPTPIFRATDGLGFPLYLGRLTTYAAGTLTPQATFVDSTQTTQNTNPIILNARGEAQIWLDPSKTYKFALTDAFGNNIPGWPVDNIPGGFGAGGLSLNLIPSPTNTFTLGNAAFTWANLYLGANGLPILDAAGNAGFVARTAAEIAATVTPSDYFYSEGDLRRYGGDPTGVADSSTAWQSAISVGVARIPKGCSFKIITPATKTGQVTILGEGLTSKLQCDSTVLTVTSGNGSLVDNFWMENLTAPYIVTRNPANWAAVLTPVQSNGAGYQPTVNDPEYATWVGAQPLVGSQNIGPALIFTGAASDINVSRIYGRFVRIVIFDAVNSMIRDCDFQGGKGSYASMLFDNVTNNVQQGVNNQALNNRVHHSSFNGIMMFANVDPTIRGNTVYSNGESGISTGQSGGVAFTASVGGATSGTLNAVFPGTTGTWQLGFSDGSVRTGTLTNGSTAATWTGALPATSILTAAYWGALGLPASVADPRCGRAVITENRAYYQYYDGLDCCSTFGVTNDATQSHHQIHNNYSYNNHGDGMNLDGQFNSVVGNHIYFNGKYGIWGFGASLSEIVGNTMIDNNQTRASLADILAVGTISLNKIADNYIWGGAGQNGPAIQVTQTSLNFVSDNICVGTSSLNLGNVGLVTSVADSNIDNITGPATPQSFCFELVNNSGTLQHIFYSDSSNQSAGLFSRINGATPVFTTTPTGADASTPMAAGAKIGSVLTNAIWFDTAVQANSAVIFLAAIVFNNTGTALNVQPMFQSININGVTRQRLTFQFSGQTSGLPFALTTANIAAGKGIYVQFSGKLA